MFTLFDHVRFIFLWKWSRFYLICLLRCNGRASCLFVCFVLIMFFGVFFTFFTTYVLFFSAYYAVTAALFVCFVLFLFVLVVQHTLTNVSLSTNCWCHEELYRVIFFTDHVSPLHCEQHSRIIHRFDVWKKCDRLAKRGESQVLYVRTNVWERLIK